MSAERTERATPKRRQEARRKGQVARSVELPGAVALLGGIVFLRWYGGFAVGIVSDQMRFSFENLNYPELTPGLAGQLGMNAGMTILKVTGPLLAVVAALAVVSTIAQSGLVFTMTPLKPDFSRLNPAQGFKRIVSKRGFFELGKSLLKLGVIGAVTWPLLQRDIERNASLTGTDPVQMGRAISQSLFDIGLRAGCAYLILSLIDYGFQRYEYENRLKMTRQEILDELKNTEGNPELKARVRRIQRQMGRNRMMAAVPTATVVLTNPTHLAIAIRYEISEMSAPVVVAKGSGFVAERIKQVAREHGILVMENKPLARALYQMTEVGMEIPVTMYEAVADIIAYVYRLRGPRTR